MCAIIDRNITFLKGDTDIAEVFGGLAVVSHLVKLLVDFSAGGVDSEFDVFQPLKFFTQVLCLLLCKVCFFALALKQRVLGFIIEGLFFGRCHSGLQTPDFIPQGSGLPNKCRFK